MKPGAGGEGKDTEEQYLIIPEKRGLKYPRQDFTCRGVLFVLSLVGCELET